MNDSGLNKLLWVLAPAPGEAIVNYFTKIDKNGRVISVNLSTDLTGFEQIRSTRPCIFRNLSGLKLTAMMEGYTICDL